MTDQHAPSRRRPWRLALPLAAVVIAALAWSGAWFYAAHRAQAEIEEWIAREATQGRNWSCADRSFAGYPFRFELICEQPTVTFAGVDGWKAAAARAHAVAQVWNPRHIIAEFQAPGTLEETATGRRFDASWTKLQTSAVGGERGRVERASLAVDGYALKEAGSPVFAARHGEVHARHTPGADGITLDIAAGVLGATGPDGAGIGGAPVDGELEATVTNLPPLRAMPQEQRLREWQEAGGRIRVLDARLVAGPSIVAATAGIGLDAQGRPDGEAVISIAGAEPLMKGLAQANVLPPILGGLGSLIGMAGAPAEIDGRKASSFTLRFADGRAFLGPIPLGQIPPAW